MRVKNPSWWICLSICAGSAALVGCDAGSATAPAQSAPAQSAAAPSAAAPSPLRITASIQDIMAAEIDRSADNLWESVGTIVSAEGVDERRPRTDEEWKRVRHEAITLIEATNLIIMDGRRLAAPGKKLEDEGVTGILTAVESQQAIDGDRASFVAFAHALHDVGVKMLEAIDGKNPEGMMDAGDALDAVCEGCHMKFWYPNQVIPEPPKF